MELSFMCLAIPSKIISIDYDTGMGEIDTMGVTRDANLSLLDEEIAVGDWILVHVGLAISRIDADEAQKTLDMYQEIIQLQDGGLNEGG
jgi:hydrogenase expression/formation protein HypC